MKRAWAAVAMIAAAVILCILGLFTTNRNIASLTELIDKAESAISQGDSQQAAQYSAEIVELWNSHYRVLCTYISHEKLELIDQSIATLQTNLRFKEYNQFCTELDRASAQLAHLRDTEMPTLENIL